MTGAGPRRPKSWAVAAIPATAPGVWTPIEWRWRQPFGKMSREWMLCDDAPFDAEVARRADADGHGWAMTRLDEQRVTLVWMPRRRAA